MEYKKVSKIEGFGKTTVGLQLLVSIGRDLTEEEEQECYHFVAQFYRKLYKNTEALDPVFQAELVKERELILDCFPQPIYVKEIPNEYSSEMNNPWFLVTTAKGVIKIGWRKRVISIDWKDSDINVDTQELFLDEDTTKGTGYIHAWGYEKAKEYIYKLLNA